MIIIETGKFKTFEEYLASLSKAARKNWRFARKKNLIAWGRSLWTKDLIQEWMYLWSHQLIRGERRQWAFTADALNEKTFVFFRAAGEDGMVATQFVEVIDGYMNCHPVMYDKEKYARKYLSKFMWFNLIKWAIENKIEIVDLGGGNDDSWRQMIETRDQYPNPAYKWMYVPKIVKEHPELQQDYRVEHHGISKRIFKVN